jgi:hypothetical protein
MESKLPIEIIFEIIKFLDLFSLIKLSCMNKFFFFSCCCQIRSIMESNLLLGDLSNFNIRALDKRYQILFQLPFYNSASSFHELMMFYKECNIILRETFTIRLFENIIDIPQVNNYNDLLYLGRNEFIDVLTKKKTFF